MRIKFKEYHEENPQVYDLFKRFAFEQVNAGRDVLSSKQIFERIRWETQVVTTGDPFKINNNYTADYARKFMDDHPDCGSHFRVRELRAA